MEAALQLRVQRYGWDAAAPYYEGGWREALRPAQDMLVKMADLAPRQDVLEIACGSGLVTRRIAEAVAPGGTVLATDISQQMVDLVGSQSLIGASVARMGAEELDVADASFDRAICALGLMYVPDPVKALSEMDRALREGGRATATVWGERRNCGWADIFPVVDAEVSSEVCPMFFATGAPDALMRDFELAGFVGLEQHRQDETLQFPDARHLLDAMLLGGPVALAVKRFNETQIMRVEQAFLNSVSDFRRADGQYAIPAEFVTVTGVRAQ